MVVFSSANATTYYLSTSGNDANNGTSTSSPWKALSKFNTPAGQGEFVVMIKFGLSATASGFCFTPV